MYVMRCISYAIPIPCPYAGQYLATFTPYADVKGSWTSEFRKAMKFPDAAAAMELWNTAIGTRPDGKPDKPLTAFTVEVIKEENL